MNLRKLIKENRDYILSTSIATPIVAIPLLLFVFIVILPTLNLMVLIQPNVSEALITNAEENGIEKEHILYFILAIIGASLLGGYYALMWCFWIGEWFANKLLRKLGLPILSSIGNKRKEKKD